MTRDRYLSILGWMGDSWAAQLVERRHHDDAHAPTKRRMLLHDAANLPAVAAGHHHVEQNDRGTDGLEQRQRLVAAVRYGGRISSDLQVLSDDLGVIGVIVDHQNRWLVGRCHCPVQVARCLARWKARYRPTKGKSQATYRRLNA